MWDSFYQILVSTPKGKDEKKSSTYWLTKNTDALHKSNYKGQFFDLS